MKEPSTNIRFMCDKHSPKADGSLSKLDPQSLVGKFVKTAFHAIDHNDKPRFEHMWVKVEKVLENGNLFGALDNNPLFPCYDEKGNRIRLRSMVEVKMNSIEEVIG